MFLSLSKFLCCLQQPPQHSARSLHSPSTSCTSPHTGRGYAWLVSALSPMLPVLPWGSPSLAAGASRAALLLNFKTSFGSKRCCEKGLNLVCLVKSLFLNKLSQTMPPVPCLLGLLPLLKDSSDQHWLSTLDLLWLSQWWQDKASLRHSNLRPLSYSEVHSPYLDSVSSKMQPNNPFRMARYIPWTFPDAMNNRNICFLTQASSPQASLLMNHQFPAHGQNSCWLHYNGVSLYLLVSLMQLWCLQDYSLFLGLSKIHFQCKTTQGKNGIQQIV